MAVEAEKLCRVFTQSVATECSVSPHYFDLSTIDLLVKLDWIGAQMACPAFTREVRQRTKQFTGAGWALRLFHLSADHEPVVCDF